MGTIHLKRVCAIWDYIEDFLDKICERPSVGGAQLDGLICVFIFDNFWCLISCYSVVSIYVAQLKHLSVNATNANKKRIKRLVDSRKTNQLLITS